MIYNTSRKYTESNYPGEVAQKDTLQRDHELMWTVGENTTSFPDSDLSVLQEKFHERMKQLIEEGNLQILLGIYESYNYASLKSNNINFIPSQRTLLLLLNSLRFRKIRNWKTVRDLASNLSAVDTGTVRLMRRINTVIDALEKERAKDKELNTWLTDLVEDRL